MKILIYSFIFLWKIFCDKKRTVHLKLKSSVILYISSLSFDQFTVLPTQTELLNCSVCVCVCMTQYCVSLTIQLIQIKSKQIAYLAYIHNISKDMDF